MQGIPNSNVKTSTMVGVDKMPHVEYIHRVLKPCYLGSVIVAQRCVAAMQQLGAGRQSDTPTMEINMIDKRIDGKFLERDRNPGSWIEKQVATITNFDGLINSPTNGLWITDGDGIILQINAATEKLHGITREQVLEKNVKDLIDAGFFDRSIILEVIKSQKPTTVIHKIKNGRQLLRIGKPIFDNQGRLRLVTIHDCDMREIELLKSDIEASQALSQEYRAELEQLQASEGLWAESNIRSDVMIKVFERAMKVARFDTTVLIQGESGVGKGYFATLIHKASKRRTNPFIRVDCGAIPEQLVEAELFGYDGGAFTGAREKGKIGYLELADSGTLFLDEIGELPLSVQVKLLRFMENNEVIRVGGTRVRRIDTRVLAATNRDLDNMVAANQFRNDLFFRLKVIPLKIPPLRERPADIPPLIYHFMKNFNQKFDIHKAIFPRALECLCRYPFAGNIRELSNLIEQLVVLSPNDRIDLEDLPSYVRVEQPRANTCLQDGEWNLPVAVARLETEIIVQALKTYGTQRKAAKPLGIDHSTLARKIKKYGIGK